MTAWPELVRGTTVHMRRGAVRNSFRYRIDCVLIDPECRQGPTLFSRNRLNLASVHDRHHGGTRGNGRGLAWARDVLGSAGAEADRILLLTQPRLLGSIFNPVSFWLAYRRADLVAAIAEVNNTFGERHSYLCAKPGFAPITAQDRVEVRKSFHVSPFQDVAGHYRFKFDIRPDRIAIRIDFRDGDGGVLAALTGARSPLTNRAILSALARNLFVPMRTILLIHLQAAILTVKGARYRPRPMPPDTEVSS